MPDIVLQAGSAPERMLLQDGSGGKCVNKMRAVFMLRRSLGTGSTFTNASAIQKTVRCKSCLSWLAQPCPWHVAESSTAS